MHRFCCYLVTPLVSCIMENTSPLSVADCQGLWFADSLAAEFLVAILAQPTGFDGSGWCIVVYVYRRCWDKISGWWFGTWLLFSIQLGMSSSQLTFTPSFFRLVGGSTTNQTSFILRSNTVYHQFGCWPQKMSPAGPSRYSPGAARASAEARGRWGEL